MMKFFRILFNLIFSNFIKLVIVIADKSYFSIYDILYNKFRIANINNITQEEQHNIKETYKYFAEQFEIEELYKDQFFDTLEKLSLKDISYVEDIKTQQLSHLNIRYVFYIIQNAKDAIEEINKVNKDNKKVSYYENSKYSSLDKLINEFEQSLKVLGHHQLIFSSCKRIFKVRKIIAKLRKNNDLFFSYYLTMFAIYPFNRLKIKEDEKDIFEFVSNLFEFYSIGHATEGHIHKSVAIQIYYFYKDKNLFTHKELKDFISVLIDLCFKTSKEFKNFNNIDQEPYIKTLVHKFPVFECNNDLSNKQLEVTRRFLYNKNLLLPKIFPKSTIQYLISKYIIKPISFYRYHSLLTFFGFMPRKK